MRGYQLVDIQVSGMWVGGSVSEDVIMSVAYRNTIDNGIIVLDVADCVGSFTGTNYLHLLQVNPHLTDHLTDMIQERFEC